MSITMAPTGYLDYMDQIWDANSTGWDFLMICGVSETEIVCPFSLYLTSQELLISFTMVPFWNSSRSGGEGRCVVLVHFLLPKPFSDDVGQGWGNWQPAPALQGSSRISAFSASIQYLHVTTGRNHPSPWISPVCWWYSAVLFWPWWIKWCCICLLLVAGGCRDLDGEQQAKTWLWVRGSLALGELPSLVIHGVTLPQTDLVHNLGVLLYLQLLVKQQVAIMARKAFAQLQVVP